MTVSKLLMRKELHTRRAQLLLAAVLMTILLPVSVLLFSLEGEASPGSVDSAQLTVPVASTASAAPGWSGDAAQSASMVLVGTFLIGLGAIVRRTV